MKIFLIDFYWKYHNFIQFKLSLDAIPNKITKISLKN